MNPYLPVSIKKTTKALTFGYEGKERSFEIIDGLIDLIELDSWITEVLLSIHDKAELRKRLMGGDDSSLSS